METAILKIIASLISLGHYFLILIAIQFVMYQITGISLAKRMMRLVARCATIEIGG